MHSLPSLVLLFTPTSLPIRMPIQYTYGSHKSRKSLCSNTRRQSCWKHPASFPASHVTTLETPHGYVTCCLPSIQLDTDQFRHMAKGLNRLCYATAQQGHMIVTILARRGKLVNVLIVVSQQPRSSDPSASIRSSCDKSFHVPHQNRAYSSSLELQIC